MSWKLGIVLATVYLAGTSECLNIVSRSDWGAAAPKHASSRLSVNPASHVVIHHSDSRSCGDKSSCKSSVKNIQQTHMNNRDFNDIGYNFLIGEDGNVYEGRGWGFQGSHAKGYNSKSIGICFIGNYINGSPNTAALNAAKELIQNGVANNKIKSNYKLVGHRQVKATECPGGKLYSEIQSWPRWSNP